jgi:nicotinamidase/pyrazinamidase
MQALILVDIQNDFCPGGALAVPDGDAVVKVANVLMPRFALTVATQDAHPKTHRSFAVNHAGKSVYEVVDLDGLPQVLWPEHCVAGTPGYAFHPALCAGQIARVFPKGTDERIDSYSGFFDNGHRKATGLGEWLTEQGIRELYVLGLATDYCVKYTVIDARKLGFDVWLVEDGCRAVELAPGDGERAIAAMRDVGATILTSGSI